VKISVERIKVYDKGLICQTRKNGVDESEIDKIAQQKFVKGPFPNKKSKKTRERW